MRIIFDDNFPVIPIKNIGFWRRLRIAWLVLFNVLDLTGDIRVELEVNLQPKQDT